MSLRFDLVVLRGCWFWLQGVALAKVPKIKFLIIIGGAKLKAESVAEKAYSSPIQCASLHFLGTSCSSVYIVLYVLSFFDLFCLKTLNWIKIQPY
jgi:hypothetical protein